LNYASANAKTRQNRKIKKEYLVKIICDESRR